MTPGNGESDDTVATRAARQEAPTPSESRRPPATRWVLVAMSVMAALVAYGANSYLSSAATDATANSFDRARPPATIAATMHPGEWRVWLEGPGTVDAVEIVDGNGRPIEVRDGDGGISYHHDGFESRVVASFTIPRGGLFPDVRVRVTGIAESPETTFAVGPADDFDYVRPARYATILAIGLMLLVGGAVAVAPILRRRRGS